MSRLNYMEDHEFAIQTIFEELSCLEKALDAGKVLDEQDSKDLLLCLKRLEKILERVDQKPSTGWDQDQEPLPPWLRPKPATQDQSNDDDEEPQADVG